MPTLFLRLRSPASHDEEGYHLAVDWRIKEDDGSLRAKGETDYRGLSDLIDPSAQWLQDPGNVVVFVPTANILALNCEVPGRSSGQIKRALPFVVEEFVASDIESMHLAHGPIKRGEPVSVNLIDRVLLEDWLACLNSLQIKPGFLIAESELLPVTGNGASLLLDGNSVIVRTRGQAATIDRENLLLALGQVPPGELLIFNGELSDLERGQLEDLELRQADVIADSAFGTLVELWNPASSALNLLQGGYTAKRPETINFGRWRAVATLAAIWVLVALVGVVAQGFWADVQADALETLEFFHRAGNVSNQVADV